MSAKKRGRPKTGEPVREIEISYSLTAEDADWLAKFAEDLGFKSRSELLTAITERLIVARFAPVGWLRIGWQIANRAHDLGLGKGAGFYNPFESLPPLPVEDRPRPTLKLPVEDLAPKETKQILATIRKELQTK